MTKKFKLNITLLVAILFIVSAIISMTICFQNYNQETLSELVGQSNLQIDVELILREKKNAEIKAVIPDTVFYLFKKDEKQIDGIYVTDENGKINVQLPKGEYYFEEITPTVGFTFDEENGEKITKYYFTVEGKEEETVLVEAYNRRLYGSLLVRKNVENNDKTSLSNAQLNKNFKFTINFSDNGTYQYSIDNGDIQNLSSGNVIELKHGQTAIFSEIPIGVMYNITEAPEENYIITSSGHNGNISESETIALFTNTYKKIETIEYGKINISKEISGENVNVNEEFEFIINFSKNGNYQYSIDNGRTNTLTNGQTIKLKHGQNAILTGIPIGTEYTILEINAEEKGYLPNVKEYKGKISSTEIVDLHFINTLKNETEIKFGTLKVKKEVLGNNIDTGKKFTFSIEFSGENSPDSATFELKKDEEIIFKDIPYGITYLIKEINPNGYEPIIESATGIIAESETNVIFKNTAPESEKVKLSITKKLAGEYLEEIENEKEFKFDLILNNEKTEFSLKNNETKEFYLEKGTTYQILEKDYFKEQYSSSIINGYGIADEENISAIITNTYVGDVKINISGVKKWDLNSKKNIKLPESITVYLKNGDWIVDKKIVTPDSNNSWKYNFIVPKYDTEGNEIKYIIEEESVDCFYPIYNDYNITNKFIEPVEVKLPDIEVLVKGDNPPITDFEVILKGPQNGPMPEGSSEDKTKKTIITGPGIIPGETLSFTNTGKFIYIISQTDLGETGWKYDDLIYYVEIDISEENGKLISSLQIKQENEIREKVLFTNVYQKIEDIIPDEDLDKPQDKPQDKPNIDKLPENITTNDKTNTNKKPLVSNPKTGDNIVFWLTSTIITGFILVLLILDNYKNKNKNKKRRKPRIGH